MDEEVSIDDPLFPTSPRSRLLARVDAVLACPNCKVPLERGAGSDKDFACPSCAIRPVWRGEQLIFGQLANEEVQSNWLNRIKELAKQHFGRFYPLAIHLLSPVCATRFPKSFLSTFDTQRDLVVDLGSGTKHYEDQVVCVDGVGYANVHVVADLEHLPFLSNSLAGLISVAVLEHTADPAALVREMERVLKPRGRVLCFVPFIQGFHASPHDYQRYTTSGLLQLFRDFEVIEIGVGAGPTSGMLWVLQEWLALLFSFGSDRLYRMILPLTWVLSPLKYLDLVLAHHPSAELIASGNFVVARKRTDPAEALESSNT